MKISLVLVFLLAPVTVFAGGLDVQNLLRQIVVAKVAEGNPQAGQIIGMVMAPNTVIKTSESGGNSANHTYSNPSNQTQTIISPQPTTAHDWVTYGRLLGKVRKIDEALAYFKKAIELEPDSAEAHYWAGVAYFKLGNRMAATREYDIIKHLNGSSIDRQTAISLAQIHGNID